MAKKAEGIRERGAGSYEINFRPFRGGSRVQKIIHAGSIAEAKVKRAEMIAEALKEKSPQDEQGKTESFDEIWPVLERNLLADDLTHKTILGLHCVYNRLFTKFRSIKYPQVFVPSQLTVLFFHEYKSYYKIEMKRSKGLRAEMQRVKIIMQRLRKLRYVSEDLIKDLREVETPKRMKKAYPEITPTSFKALLVKVKKDRPDLYGPIYFMARTGRRVEETTLIERADISWDGFNPVKINIRAETTKTDTAAPLSHLDQDLQTHVRAYYNLHKGRYLFLNKYGNKINQKMITKYLGVISEDILKIRITAHYLRHRFCTETCKARLPLADIQAICGIRDIKILNDYYCHASLEGQASVLEKTRL